MTYRRIVNTADGTVEISMNVVNSVGSVTATNNRAEYYANQAKLYRDETQLLRNAVQDYAQNNLSNVSAEQLEDAIDELEGKINLKQNAGNYALATDIPQKVSDLTNDSGFISTVPVATSNSNGIVKPDGTTITIDSSGTLSATAGSGGSGGSVDPVTVAGYSFPSKTYHTDLTTSTSGTSYTAPSTGWVFFQRKAVAVGEYIALTNTSSKLLASSSMSASQNSFSLRVYIPVSKNDSFKINYTANGTTDYFRFIYARGCESEATP